MLFRVEARNADTGTHVSTQLEARTKADVLALAASLGLEDVRVELVAGQRCSDERAETSGDNTGLGPTSLQKGLINPRGPKWLWAIGGLFVLVVVGLWSWGMYALLSTAEPSGVAIAALTGLIVCEILLVVVPIRVATRKPVGRGSLWPAILGSGALAALLVWGMVLALTELALPEPRTELSVRIGLSIAISAAVVIWSAWILVFFIMSYRQEPLGIAAKLHGLLLRGSILQLLVNLPAHLIVRRRSECCAGFLTGIGIGSGVVVMLLAFGPGIAFLIVRRCMDITPETKSELNSLPRAAWWPWVALGLVAAVLLVIALATWTR